MDDRRQINPYESPTSLPEVVIPRRELDPAPCPRCGSHDAAATPYSAWHGRRAPKAVQDVTCKECRCNFNGETGGAYPPRKNPMIWFLISLALLVLYLIVYCGFIIPAIL